MQDGEPRHRELLPARTSANLEAARRVPMVGFYSRLIPALGFAGSLTLVVLTYAETKDLAFLVLPAGFLVSLLWSLRVGVYLTSDSVIVRSFITTRLVRLSLLDEVSIEPYEGWWVGNVSTGGFLGLWMTQLSVGFQSFPSTNMPRRSARRAAEMISGAAGLISTGPELEDRFREHWFRPDDSYEEGSRRERIK